jgi:hypothetical protein
MMAGGTHHHHIQQQEQEAIRIPAPISIQPPPPVPQVKVDTQGVLNSVAHMPRKHLGSELYEVAISPAANYHIPCNDRNGYYMQYQAARRLNESHLNSTIAIRVPRKYLTREQLVKLMQDRYLFGTEVYTEDSDPLLAAIHSGWLRGAWPDDIDEGMLELAPVADSSLPPNEEVIDTKPKNPFIRPEEREVHITLLILPKLKKYQSSLRYGLKSREWGDNHDGLSFLVTSVRFTDEGDSRRWGRTGRDRKKRMWHRELAPGDSSEPSSLTFSSTKRIMVNNANVSATAPESETVDGISASVENVSLANEGEGSASDPVDPVEDEME